MSGSIPKITARHMTATDRIEHKLTSIMREIDKIPTRFHLMAVAGAAGGFWAVVIVVVIEVLR